MTKKDLEKEVKEKIKPLLDHAMQKFLGVKIDELGRDITTKLETSPLLGFNIDTSLQFKEAKKEFLKKYLQKLLEINYGNVSEVAKIADVDRRSVHRIVKEGHIDISKIRHDMAKAYEIKKGAVGDIIEDVLEDYKEIIHPMKMDDMYANVSFLSEDIVDVLPKKQLTLKEAEEEFEKEYIKKALEENEGNITKTAKKIGLRYETLQRKVKRMG